MKRFIFCLLFALPACGPQDSTGVGNPGLTKEEQALVDDGSDGTSASDNAASLIGVATKTLTAASLASSATAAAEGAKVANRFLPLGCAKSSVAGDVTTLTFAGCKTGPFGLSGIDGKLEITYTSSPTSIEVACKSISPFTVERLNRKGILVSAVVVLDAKATWQYVDATTQKSSWSGNYTATAESVVVDHSASFDAVNTDDGMGQTCVTLSGDATTTFNETAGITTTVTSYRRCGPRTNCPDAGGAVNYERTADKSFIKIEFLGGTKARVTTPKHTLVIDNLLKCVP